MKKHILISSLIAVGILLAALISLASSQTAWASTDAPEATPTMPPPIIEFPGIAWVDTSGVLTDTLIPDTSGAAGHTHYLQAVNTSIALYRKDGTQIDIAEFNQFWNTANTGTICDSAENDFHHGQPYVMYDHLAGRWVAVDVAYDPALIDDGPYYLCLAVSNDLMAPMTASVYFNSTYWYYYAIKTYHDNQDYYPDMPKLGLWPNGYYMSIDLFDVDNNGTYWSPRGVKVYALNRADLTSGVQGFLYKDFYLEEGKGYEHLVPSNLLGTPPSIDTPNYFTAIDTSAFYIWEFDVDWSNPAYSTFGVTRDGKLQEPNTILLTGYNDWPIETFIPQQGVIQKLPAHGDRLMSPVQYRILDGVPSLWATHTVHDPARAGNVALSWYEIQFYEGADPDFAQKGLYNPTSHARWLGSLATDRMGNMAIGFSISSSTISPAVKYAGRLRNDSLGMITYGDRALSLLPAPQPFTGSQDDGDADALDGLWGRQSQMSIDPMDECVFW